MHELPDEYLADAMPIAKKIAIAQRVENYNILQNNGRIAHQVERLLFMILIRFNLVSTNFKEVDHVHFHVIPKPSEEDGLVVGWPATKPEMGELQKILEDIKGRL